MVQTSNGQCSGELPNVRVERAGRSPAGAPQARYGPRACGALPPAFHGPLQRIVRFHALLPLRTLAEPAFTRDVSPLLWCHCASDMLG